MGRAKIKAAGLLKRLSGISAFGFGLSWKPKESERDAIRRLIVFLEDKRALYIRKDREIPDYVRMSISEIRQALNEAIQGVGDGSRALDSLRVMRAACTSFETNYGNLDWRHRHEYDGDFFIELGMLRTIFGQQLLVLAHQYKLDLDEGLASILPPEPAE